MEPTSYLPTLRRKVTEMGSIGQAFDAAGFWMWAILVVVVATALWYPIQVVITGWYRRLPSVVWWIGPALVVTMGGCGIDAALTEPASAFTNASQAQQLQLLARRASLGLNYVGFTALAVAILGVGVALGSGLGNLIGTDEADLAWRRPLAAGSAALVGSIGLGFWAVQSNLGAASLFIPATLLLGTFGAALAALPRGGTRSRGEKAADRFTASLGMVLAVVAAATLAAILGIIEAFKALEHAEPGSREELMMRGLELVYQIGDIGLVGTGIALVVGGALTAVELEGVGSRRFAVEAGLCLVVFIPPITSTWIAESRADPFVRAYANHFFETDAPESEALDTPPRSEDVRQLDGDSTHSAGDDQSDAGQRDGQ